MADLRGYAKPLRSGAISIVALALSLCFKMIEIRSDLGIAEGKTLSRHELIYEYGLLSVQYELILISFILLTEAQFALPMEKRGPLATGWPVLFICAILALAASAYTRNITLSTILLLDGLGLFTIAFSVVVARER